MQFDEMMNFFFVVTIKDGGKKQNILSRKAANVKDFLFVNGGRMFDKSKWIWYALASADDTYGEFRAHFYCRGDGEKTFCRISCDGDYQLYINGMFVASDQYGDYEHYKIYDDIDISRYVTAGKNLFAVRVWHPGMATQRYIPAQAGVIFEVTMSGQTALVSAKNVMARQSPAFANGYCKVITPQLGLSFLYDAEKEDGWISGDAAGFVPATEVDKKCSFSARPVAKLVYGATVFAKEVKTYSDKNYVADLGEERVGMPRLRLFSSCRQKITVSYGEYLQDGHVRRKVGAWRDFSFEYIAKRGENDFFCPFLKMGCRYMEITGESAFNLEKAGCVPHYYDVDKTPFTLSGALDAAIDDICVRTLRLCMSNHYVDCPWREQDLYVLDARNQMLCGYYVFSNGNREYARANLLLMSKDRRDDGLLSICFPCGVNLTIPSFTLYYFLAVREYIDFTGDKSLAEDVYEKLCDILNAVLSNMLDGLVVRWSGKQYWNFYEWTNVMSGNLRQIDEPLPDVMINALTVMALDNFEKICAYAKKPYKYADLRHNLANNILKAYYDCDKKRFFFSEDNRVYTELANALCVLCDIAPPQDAKDICRALADGEMDACTLSMRVFKYDALLKTDCGQYARTVLDEIRRDYSKMLDAGSTTVWETMEGAAAFSEAGSLCHGWSAMPAYYFRRLKDYLPQ